MARRAHRSKEIAAPSHTALKPHTSHPPSSRQMPPHHRAAGDADVPCRRALLTTAAVHALMWMPRRARPTRAGCAARPGRAPQVAPSRPRPPHTPEQQTAPEGSTWTTQAQQQHRANTERRSARRVPRWLSERGRPSGPPRRLKSSRRAAAREGNRTTPGEGSSSTPSRQRATRHARRSRRGEAGACCTRAPRRDDDHCCEGSTPHGWSNRRGGGGGGGGGRREARDARVVPREMGDGR